MFTDFIWKVFQFNSDRIITFSIPTIARLFVKEFNIKSVGMYRGFQILEVDGSSVLYIDPESSNNLLNWGWHDWLQSRMVRHRRRIIRPVAEQVQPTGKPNGVSIEKPAQARIEKPVPHEHQPGIADLILNRHSANVGFVATDTAFAGGYAFTVFGEFITGDNVTRATDDIADARQRIADEVEHLSIRFALKSHEAMPHQIGDSVVALDLGNGSGKASGVLGRLDVVFVFLLSSKAVDAEGVGLFLGVVGG